MINAPWQVWVVGIGALIIYTGGHKALQGIFSRNVKIK